MTYLLSSNLYWNCNMIQLFFRIKELYENVLQYSVFIILCLLDVITFANCIYCFLLSSYCPYSILFLLTTLYLDMSLNSFRPLISCHCQYVTLYQWNILSAVPGQSLSAMSLLSSLWITVQGRKLRNCKNIPSCSEVCTQCFFMCVVLFSALSI